jgi:hypothetical protein
MKYPIEIERREGAFPIVLTRTSKTRFSVIYGEEWHQDLTWLEAAAEFGRCLFHSLECEGKIPDCGRN